MAVALGIRTWVAVRGSNVDDAQKIGNLFRASWRIRHTPSTNARAQVDDDCEYPVARVPTARAILTFYLVHLVLLLECCIPGTLGITAVVCIPGTLFS